MERPNLPFAPPSLASQSPTTLLREDGGGLMFVSLPAFLAAVGPSFEELRAFPSQFDASAVPIRATPPPPVVRFLTATPAREAGTDGLLFASHPHSLGDGPSFDEVHAYGAPQPPVTFDFRDIREAVNAAQQAMAAAEEACPGSSVVAVWAGEEGGWGTAGGDGALPPPPSILAETAGRATTLPLERRKGGGQRRM
jgi:hypothetical protein